MGVDAGASTRPDDGLPQRPMMHRGMVETRLLCEGRVSRAGGKHIDTGVDRAGVEFDARDPRPVAYQRLGGHRGRDDPLRDRAGEPAHQGGDIEYEVVDFDRVAAPM